MSFEEEKTGKYPVNPGGFKVLSDDDAMPQKGKFEGTRMGDVPAWYLLWLSDNDKCSKSVRAYITDNKERIYREGGRELPGFATRPVRSRWRG